MTLLVSEREEGSGTRAASVVAPRPYAMGEAGARLLAGPGQATGSMSFVDHVDRFGALPAEVDPDQLLTAVAQAGLAGRGGGSFPTARKIATAAGGTDPLIVINASESEPASRKDRVLCGLRPHLVLDGARLAAVATGATDVVVYAHRGSASTASTLREAMTERMSQPGEPRWHLSLGPDRYVAGEASAVASFVAGGLAKPRYLPEPLALSGLDGRPVLVQNAETVAHLALIARYGSEWWRQAGSAASPGSRLVTVAGAVLHAGIVLEVCQPVTIGALLACAGADRAPAAVLVGGYAGRWLPGRLAWDTPFEAAALHTVGASPGCGVLGVLPVNACGVAETARIATYLAGENAGQCGPCVFGLPDMATSLTDLARGLGGRRGVRRLWRQAEGVIGRGACRHPDGVAALVTGALEAFADDVGRHSRGRPCAGVGHPPVLPIPSPVTVWR